MYVDDPGDGGSVPGSGRTIKKGWTDMTDDTATLTSDDLETITAALWPVWEDLVLRDRAAADWIAARIIECREEVAERHDRMYDELAGLDADSDAEPLISEDEIAAKTGDSGHITFGGHDEVAGRADRAEAGPWAASCETCEDNGGDFHFGYYATEAEANTARARHVEEAGDR